MHDLSSIHQKVLELYHNDGYDKAWSYWKLMGLNYGIFLGEVKANEFVNGDELASKINLLDGVSQYSDTSWLKFILDCNIVYIPKKPIRRSISWEHLKQVGETHDGEITISVDGNSYDVTLIRGSAAAHRSDSTVVCDSSFTHDSEWNRLLYPIHEYTLDGYPWNAHRTTSVPLNVWASYTYIGNLNSNRGQGSYCWCIDPHQTDEDRPLVRGCHSVMGSKLSHHTNAGLMNGWRPLLRLR